MGTNRMNPELGSLLYLLLVIPLSVISDALRDRWKSAYLEKYSSFKVAQARLWEREPEKVSRCWPPIAFLLTRPWVWWRWHLIKWVNLYAPHAFIVHLLWPNLRWYEVALVAILMYFVWRRIYNYGEKK